MPARPPSDPASPADASSPEALASAFGDLVRRSRTALGMTQDDLALSAGLGRRFIIELEGGKPSCRLGPSLAVLAALGVHLPLAAPDPSDEQ